MTHKQFNNVLRASIVMLFLMIAFTVQTFAQDKKLVADETFVKQLKSSIKVETSNEAIFNLLLRSFPNDILRYSVATKTDRKGSYKLYAIPFKLVDAERLNQFFNKINKSK